MSEQKALIDFKRERSHSFTITWEDPVEDMMYLAADCPRSSDRTARMTRAPRAASPLAVSKPIPVLPPVMTTVLLSIRAVLLHLPVVILKYTLERRMRSKRTLRNNKAKYETMFSVILISSGSGYSTCTEYNNTML